MQQISVYWFCILQLPWIHLLVLMVFGGVWALFKELLLGWALGWGRLHMGPLGDVPVCHRPLGLMDRRSFGLQSYFAWLVFQVLVLKVGSWCRMQTLLSSGRTFKFWVPSWLWVTSLGVGFTVRLCLSLTYPFWYGFPLVFLMWRNHSTSF